MVGAIWKPLAPAPINATRAPVMSRSAGHRDEWNDGPRKLSIPGRSGIRGKFREPTALMTNCAVSTSGGPSGGSIATRQHACSSSHVIELTVVLNRQLGRNSY